MNSKALAVGLALSGVSVALLAYALYLQPDPHCIVGLACESHGTYIFSGADGWPAAYERYVQPFAWSEGFAVTAVVFAAGWASVRFSSRAFPKTSRLWRAVLLPLFAVSMAGFVLLAFFTDAFGSLGTYWNNMAFFALDTEASRAYSLIFGFVGLPYGKAAGLWFSLSLVSFFILDRGLVRTALLGSLIAFLFETTLITLYPLYANLYVVTAQLGTSLVWFSNEDLLLSSGLLALALLALSCATTVNTPARARQGP